MHGRYIKLAFHGEALMKSAIPLVATGHERGFVAGEDVHSFRLEAVGRIRSSQPLLTDFLANKSHKVTTAHLLVCACKILTLK